MKKSGVGKENGVGPMQNNQLIPWEEVGRWHQTECGSQNACAEDEKKKTGLDLRVADTLDKKLWEIQEVREDGEDQPIRT